MSAPLSVLNLAARQRMLSQRLVMLMLLASAGDKSRLEMARQTLTLFSDSQATLHKTAHQLTGTAGARLRAVYDGPQGTTALTGRFVQLAQAWLAGAASARVTAPDGPLAELTTLVDPVLQALNRVTEVFDALDQEDKGHQQRQLVAVVENIQSVAREAKIVSFNAQVIAARAGEVGREFAVVAHTLSRISQQVDRLSLDGLSIVQKRPA